MFTKKIAVVSVINDLVNDNRVNKTCLALMECGYEVLLIGRKLPNSRPLPQWPYKAKRMALFFTKGVAFYLFFNLRLFFRLLITKTHLLYANDLDTLLPNFLISRLKNVPLIYDSHELFCEVPELQNSPVKKKIWLWLERTLVPRVKTCITINSSIAAIFKKNYNTKFHVVRNIANPPENFKPKTRKELGLPEDKKIILLQGAGINVDRGAEELIEAMERVEGAVLLIIGGGDVWEILARKIKYKNLEAKVKMMDKMVKNELMHYTFNSDLGLSIDKNTNLNYYYSLPNKIFDYMQAGVPILASRLPEIEKVIDQYHIGDYINDHNPQSIADKLNQLLNSNKLLEYKKNTILAACELNWKNEKQALLKAISQANT